MGANKVRIVINEAGVRELLATSGKDAVESRGDKVLARAKASAPVVTGDYRDHLVAESVTDPTTGEPEIRVGSTSKHAIFVEAEHGNVVRALDAAE